MTPLRKAGLVVLMILVGVAPALTLLADPLPQPQREDAAPDAVLPPDATLPDGDGKRPTTLDEEELDEGEHEEERDDPREERRKNHRDDEDDRPKGDHGERDEPADDDQWISLRIGG